jgi:ribose/xylose/arabinose/galactoside ABC-type transport system permease subunit
VNDRDGPSDPAVNPRGGYHRWLRHLSVLAPFLGLLFIYLFFAVYDVATDGSLDQLPLLFSRFNLKIVAAQTTIVALAALGMTIIIISGGIDLSPGSSIALTTTVVAVWMRDGPLAVSEWSVLAPLLALSLGIVSAGLIGAANGVLITGLRIVPFIVTLGMMGIARGLAKFLGEEQRVNAPETWLSGLLSVDPRYAAFWGLPWGVVALALFAVAMHFLLHYSVFGRHVFAIGSNESTARLCGVHVSRRKILIYTISGLLTGVAGVMQFSQLTVGDPTVAVG